MGKIVCWFSGGVTSTVATKLALERYDDVEIIFFETGSHHPDNDRYFAECEKWFGQPIIVLQDEKHEDIYSIFEEKRFINSPYGSPCTQILKKKVRQKWEDEVDYKNNYDGQVFGFDCSPREYKRAERFHKEYPYTKPLFPLIGCNLTKEDCFDIMERNGIEIPKMYRLGYGNNNCIGCVKGGMGYWNKIRIDFPEVFEKTASLEREIGATCITDRNGNRVYLDELDPNRGWELKPYVEPCGSFCDDLDGVE